MKSHVALNKYNICILELLFLIYPQRFGINIIIIFKGRENTNEFVHISEMFIMYVHVTSEPGK